MMLVLQANKMKELELWMSAHTMATAAKSLRIEE